MEIHHELQSSKSGRSWYFAATIARQAHSRLKAFLQQVEDNKESKVARTRKLLANRLWTMQNIVESLMIECCLKEFDIIQGICNCNKQGISLAMCSVGS